MGHSHFPPFIFHAGPYGLEIYPGAHMPHGGGSRMHSERMGTGQHDGPGRAATRWARWPEEWVTPLTPLTPLSGFLGGFGFPLLEVYGLKISPPRGNGGSMRRSKGMTIWRGDSDTMDRRAPPWVRQAWLQAIQVLIRSGRGQGGRAFPNDPRGRGRGSNLRRPYEGAGEEKTECWLAPNQLLE